MLKLVRVQGESLTPDYLDGDFVLVSKVPFWLLGVRVGDVVLFHQPGYGLLIKKVTAVHPSERTVEVTGSHPWSIDSRQFGPVSQVDLVGRVIWHIKKPRRSSR